VLAEGAVVHGARSRTPVGSAQGWQVLIVVEHVAEEITACGKALRQGTDRESVGSQRRVVEFRP
jgi:hypothetical protein